MDHSGHIFRESHALGCKITHYFTRPYICLVGDEVDGNISMTGDEHQGGKLFLYPKGTTYQQKLSTQYKHFTMIRLTMLIGEPVMCIIIITGKQPSTLVEMEINNST